MELELTVKDPIVRGALALFPVYSHTAPAAAYLTGPRAEVAGAHPGPRPGRAATRRATCAASTPRR